MITHATPAEACTGSALGLLFRQARDAMWARMERELAAAGHELNFSQFITLKRLSAGPAGVTDLARAVDQCGQRVRARALRGMDDATRAQLTRLVEQVRDNLLSED